MEFLHLRPVFSFHCILESVIKKRPSYVLRRCRTTEPLRQLFFDSLIFPLLYAQPPQHWLNLFLFFVHLTAAPKTIVVPLYHTQLGCILRSCVEHYTRSMKFEDSLRLYRVIVPEGGVGMCTVLFPYNSVLFTGPLSTQPLTIIKETL